MGRSPAASTGFSLVEMTVTLAVAGIFMIAVTGFLESSLGIAAKHQARTESRSGTRFAADYLLSELAGAGGRVPLDLALGVDTINNVTDASRADVGTDTLAVVRSRKGARSRVLAVFGSAAIGTMRLAFHAADDSGPNAICATVEKCVDAFVAEHGGQGDLLLVSDDTDYWAVRIKYPPTASLGSGGYIELDYLGVLNNTGGASFAVGDTVTGIEARNFRVMNETLEMQEGFYNADGEFTVMATDVEDLQLGFIMSDGSYVNDSIPLFMDSIEAIALSLVTIQPADRSLRGAAFHRPEVEDHAAGTQLSNRRRSVLRTIVWGRNLAL